MYHMYSLHFLASLLIVLITAGRSKVGNKKDGKEL